MIGRSCVKKCSWNLKSVRRHRRDPVPVPLRCPRDVVAFSLFQGHIVMYFHTQRMVIGWGDAWKAGGTRGTADRSLAGKEVSEKALPGGSHSRAFWLSG